jgi:hypothetical protein
VGTRNENTSLQENMKSLEQACQTQTTLRAKKATKTVEGAAKVLKNFSAGYI